MKRLQSLIPIFGVAAVSLFGVASCGDNSVSCGDGTHAEDGLCVPDATCGPGTKEDPGTGKCVPDGSVVCPQGTTFEDGVCQLDDDACADGTVLVDGECVPEDDTLHADLEEAAEPNDDPAAPAGMLTVGAVDSSTVIHGCVDPGRVGGDIDFDLWVVNATGPTTLEITADGVHGLVAGFVMVNNDPALASVLSQWQRFGINLTGDTAKRQVYLPAAGSYGLLMSDARSLFLTDGAAGGPEACYYTTIKRVATPAPVALTFPATNSTDNGNVKLFTFTAPTTGRIFDIEETADSGAMDPAFMVLRGNALEASIGSDPNFYTAGGLDMGQVVTVVSDMRYNYATTPQAFTYNLFDINAPQLPANGTLTLTKRNGATASAPWWDRNYVYFDVAAANTIVNFNVTAASTATPPVALPLDMAIFRRNIFTLAGAGDTVTVIDNFGVPGRTGGFANQFVKFAQPGRYYFVVQDPSGTSGQTYTVTSSYNVVAAPAITLGTPVAANTPLPVNGNAFHTLDLTNPTWLQFGASGTNFPVGTATERLSFYDLAGAGWIGGTGASGNLTPSFSYTLNADGSNPAGRIMIGDTKDYLVRVEAVGTLGATPMYGLDFKNRDFVNLGTIATGTPITRNGMDDIAAMVGTTPGVKRFLVLGTAGNALSATVTPVNVLNDIGIRRLNADESTAGSLINAAGVGAAESFAGIFFSAAPANWQAFEVQNRTLVNNTNINMTLTSAPPPYAVANNTGIAWTDVCPPAGTAVGTTVAGSTLLATDGDDEFIARRPIGFNFPFFATPATHYILSTNGIVALGDATLANPACDANSNTACWNNPAIPNAAAPNNIIAPFWDDFQHTVVCVKEEATKVTVQWVGVHYATTTAIATQAIINMNGTINYLWKAAPAHADAGNTTATIGVENATGATGIQISFNAAIALAGTSKTLTPQ